MTQVRDGGPATPVRSDVRSAAWRRHEGASL